MVVCLAALWALAASVVIGSERPPRPALPMRVFAAAKPTRGDVLVILGAEGTPEFGKQFAEWCGLWEAAAERGDCRFHVIGDLVGDAASHAAKRDLQAAIAAAAQESQLPLWVVLVGHGTFDGRSAKFNLVGEDFTADEFAAWMQPITRPTAVLQCASTSAAFLPTLSQGARVVITSTKSGQEVNFARFGGFLAAALADPVADVDKDAQVSLLEAFLRAARLTDEYYTGDNRLATEHPLIDDNGDGRGTRAASFAGVRPVRESDSATTLDGYAAHQWLLIPNLDLPVLPPAAEQRRRELEIAVLQLRERKSELSADEYYGQLEALLVELARLSLGQPLSPAAAPPQSSP